MSDSRNSKPPLRTRLACLLKGHSWDGENARCTRCKRWHPDLVRAGRVGGKYE